MAAKTVSAERKGKRRGRVQPAPRRSRGREAKKLYIVANRLPVRPTVRGDTTTWKLSPGGLVSALVPIVRDTGGTWIGWEGRVGAASKPFELDGLDLQPVPLSKKELNDYYYGFSNRTLWPLYHDGVRWPEYHRDWWHTYEAVNERFAEAVATTASRSSRAWIHDYHLQLVPAMLRRMRPDMRIGFFLHTPFPPPELFAQLPWRRELLDGLLGADVIGFQTAHGAGNFVRLAKRYLHVTGSHGKLKIGNRTVRVGDFPVSIDVERFEKFADDPAVRDSAKRLRQRLGEERKLVLGVDRLDYTKGIDVRLKSFRELLSRDFSVRDVAFVQCAVPSREGVAAYNELKRKVETLVGSINGEFGQVGTVAVHYLYRNHTAQELACLYAAADVMMVTPFRDGMNLVAKEYVAGRVDDSGVLVLSEFTGAANELRQALTVNPHDVDGLASTLAHALTMPQAESTRRMRALRRIVRQHDVHDWGREFLDALNY